LYFVIFIVFALVGVTKSADAAVGVALSLAALASPTAVLNAPRPH